MPYLLSDVLAEHAAQAYLAPATLRLHRVGIASLARTVGREPTTDDLTDSTLARHAARRMADGASRATIAAEFCKLLALWRFAAKRRYVEEWPTVRAPKIPERVPLAWTRAELDRLFAAAHFALPVGRVPGSHWWSALFGVLWNTGERINAVLQLQWSGVDLGGLTLFLPAEVRKGSTRDKLYAIDRETADALAKLPRDRPPFFWPHCMGTLWNRFGKMLELAGLPHDRRSKFHRIRRSFASHLAAAGGDPTAALDHSSPSVTKRSYLDPRIATGPRPVDLLFRPGTQSTP